MRPHGSPAELERRRLRALELRQEGLQPHVVARRLGVDRRRRGSVSDRAEYGGARPNYPGCCPADYNQSCTPFVWTRGPEHLQKIVEKTKQFQAAHPRPPRQSRKKSADSINN